MAARDPDEAHRVATPLELFFDLCVVVAVAQTASSLHHALAHGHGTGVLGFAMVFFAVWWAWMNFTWFASAYDVDDVPYRLLVLLQIAGVLVLAAGVPRAFAHRNFDIATLGYVIMRIGLVALWIRAGLSDRARRQTALRYALGITLCQAGWIVLLLLPPAIRLPVFAALCIIELAIPIWAERPEPTRWHPHHIAERYGLLTLIVIGESMLSSTLAIQAAVDDGGLDLPLTGVIIGALGIAFAMWWIYFDDSETKHPTATETASFVWGYGHFVLFAAAAATGAGIAVTVDQVTGAAHLARWQAGAALAIPVALYVLAVWAIHVRPRCADGTIIVSYPIAAAAVLVAGLFPAPVLVIAGILTGLVMVTTVTRALHDTADRSQTR